MSGPVMAAELNSSGGISHSCYKIQTNISMVKRKRKSTQQTCFSNGKFFLTLGF